MVKGLFDLGVESFIKSSLDNDGDRKKPLIFIHIGKTAGSSFREELADRFQPCENVFVDFSKIELPISPEKYAAIMERNLSDLNDNRMRKCKMVSGHFSYEQIARQSKLAQGRLIALLRNPISRLASSYEYHGSVAHPDRNSFITQYPTFRDYILDPRNVNQIYRQLTPGNSCDAADAVEWISNNYYWIGLQEQYVASVKLLFAMNGMRFSPQHRIRESEPSHVGFDASDIRLAEDLNQIDLQIFNSFNDRYASISDEIYQLTDYDRIFSLYLTEQV